MFKFTSDIIVVYASWLASERLTVSLMVSGLSLEGGRESRPSFRAATLTRRDSTVLGLVLESKLSRELSRDRRTTRLLSTVRRSSALDVRSRRTTRLSTVRRSSALDARSRRGLGFTFGLVAAFEMEECRCM